MYSVRIKEDVRRENLLLELVHIIKEDFSVNTHYRPLFISFSCTFLIKCVPLAELISNSTTFVSLRSSLRLTY